MTDQRQRKPGDRRDNYNQFRIALALGTMISAAGLFFFEYFGIIDFVKGWP